MADVKREIDVQDDKQRPLHGELPMPFMHDGAGQLHFSFAVAVSVAVTATRETDARLTPPRECAIIRAIAGDDGIGLDPFDHPDSLTGARERWFLRDGRDGFTESWAGRGFVYWNPPYSQPHLPAATEKAADEWRRFAVESVGLIPADTSTRLFHQLVARRADAVCFLGHRVKYLRPDKVKDRSGPEFPSMFVYYGPHAARFLDACAPHGTVWLPREGRTVPQLPERASKREQLRRELREAAAAAPAPAPARRKRAGKPPVLSKRGQDITATLERDARRKKGGRR